MIRAVKQTRAEKEPAEYNKRVVELYKKQKPELLAEYKRMYRANSADNKTPKGVIISEILDAEGWY